MKRDYEDYLNDMLENAEKALSFVEGLDFEGFRSFRHVSPRGGVTGGLNYRWPSSMQ